MITAGTYLKKSHLDTPEKRDFFMKLLFQTVREFQWSLCAWAILSNHYHLVAQTELEKPDLRSWLGTLHRRSAAELNRADQSTGREIWFNYWDTHITHQTSLLARLHYVHVNPAKHGIVLDPTQYRWCSAAWFETNFRPAFVQSVYRFKTDKLNVEDDF